MGSRQRVQSEALRQVAVQLRTPGRTLSEHFATLCRAGAEFLEVSRASVWLFNEDRSLLGCANGYERDGEQHCSGQQLLAEHYPRYFSACSDLQALAVRDVHADPRVAELCTYFTEAGIRSMLDAPIYVGSAALGVVCHEDTSRARDWTPEEQAFAAWLAQLAANVIAADRWRAREEELRRSEALYRSIVEDFTDVVVRIDREGRIVEVNPMATELRGSDPVEMQGRTVFEITPPEEHHVFLDAVRQATPQSPVVHYTHHALGVGGERMLFDWTSRVFFDEHGQPTDCRSIGRDVTEQRRREAKLREAERLQALAVFSGGIAHDLNNLLTPVLVFTDAAISSLPSDRAEVDDLKEVSKAAMRARSLVRQVLLFSRPSEGVERTTMDPTPYVSEASALVRASAPSSVEFDTTLPQERAAIRADPSDLFQIVSNLCTNAVQAMPTGGHLRVTASLEPETYRIEVADTGAGIPREVADSIFDPFFTTKPVGEGTGLGLSVIRSIVEQLGGTITFESKPGQGTTFVVRLPLTRAPDERPENPSDTRQRSAGSEHLLVVDDEPHVLHSVCGGLRALGYEVTPEQSALDAMARLERNETFDLVLTDDTMPAVSGLELARSMRERNIDVPIILMSGAAPPDESVDVSVSAVLTKPFRLSELATNVRAALDAATGVPAPRSEDADAERPTSRPTAE